MIGCVVPAYVRVVEWVKQIIRSSKPTYRNARDVEHEVFESKQPKLSYRGQRLGTQRHKKGGKHMRRDQTLITIVAAPRLRLMRIERLFSYDASGNTHTYMCHTHLVQRAVNFQPALHLFVKVTQQALLPHVVQNAHAHPLGWSTGLLADARTATFTIQSKRVESAHAKQRQRERERQRQQVTIGRIIRIGIVPKAHKAVHAIHTLWIHNAKGCFSIATKTTRAASLNMAWRNMSRFCTYEHRTYTTNQLEVTVAPLTFPHHSAPASTAAVTTLTSNPPTTNSSSLVTTAATTLQARRWVSLSSHKV